jgi:hypothetical protein
MPEMTEKSFFEKFHRSYTTCPRVTCPKVSRYGCFYLDYESKDRDCYEMRLSGYYGIPKDLLWRLENERGGTRK